jgi:transcriptional regulator with XRE-family HTH domain
MTQHELFAHVRVVGNYNLDTLGAPFKVTLTNGVTRTVDPKTGKETIKIADPIGLILAVVRCRVLDPCKLSGPEIRFVRKSLGLPANKLASFLDFTPEHYSRCEAGTRALAASSERQLRLFAFAATLFNNPETLLEGSIEDAGPPKKHSPRAKRFSEFFKIFLSMKINPVRNAEEEIEYVFSRRAACDQSADLDNCGCDWIEPPESRAA